MAEEKKSENKTKDKNLETAGYKPIKKGYQPTQGQLDSAKPPEGESGVPDKPVDSGEEKK